MLFIKKASEEKNKNAPVKLHGTVGAVATDRFGNIAAATSTGGTSSQKEGRISDSCMIGTGCYANNETCAVSATGDGEHIMRAVLCHAVSSAVEFKTKNVQEACDYVIHEKNKNLEGDMGVIAIDKNANIATSFNSDTMVRGWRIEGEEDIHFEMFK
jgi:L-asparaginase / beta-aspartyl-peptidase